MGDNNKFFNKNRFNDQQRRVENFQQNNKPVETPVENFQQNNKSVEKNVEEKVLDKTNYLNLDKKPEEKLVSNGKVFKHGSVQKCNILNFRERPSKESAIIHTFEAGQDILYSETNDQLWFEVKDKDGKIGYCMSEYIKIEV